MKAIMVMVFAVCVSACGTSSVVDDPVVDITSSDQRMHDWLVEGPALAAPAATDDEVSDAAPVQGAVAPAVTCSVVQYCDAPGPDGTRCVYQGCSLVQALEQCSRDAPAECGRTVCPFVFVARGGKRLLNGSCE